MALSSKAALGPNNGLVFAVMIVPSANSMAADATPESDLRWRAATIQRRSSNVIWARLMSREILLTSFSVDLPSTTLQRAEFGIWAMDDLEVIGGYNFVASQVLAGDFDNEHGHLPCYSLFDVKAIYEPHWAQGWKISFIVENLLDRRYCDFAGWSDYGGAYYYPAAGRSFMVTISYEW